MPGITITNDVRKILTGASPAGDLLVITQQLDPGVWLQVKKVLTAAGGKWNRSRGGTEFPGKQAADVLAQLLHADRVVNEAQRDGWFATPAPVVARILALAHLAPGLTVLEPSAGEGAIARPAAQDHGCRVDVVELDDLRYNSLCGQGLYTMTVHRDFLTMGPPRGGFYDRVLMNPPFARANGHGYQDVAHITHAYRFLRPSGLLVSVASMGVSFRSDRRTLGLRELVSIRHGRIQPLPDNAFTESGTGFSTCLVILPGPTWKDPGDG